MKALSQAIEQVVVRIEMALRMSAWIFLTFACARQRTFKDVTKIKHVIAGRQHRVRNVLMHQTKARAIVKVFACGVCMRVEIMKQPWRRKDPVLKTLVVITVGRVCRQHTIVNRPRQAGPGRRFGSFVIKRVSGYTQTCDRNESVILAIGEGLTRLRLKIVGHQARLFDQFIPITRAFFFAQVVIEQVIAPAQPVQQMTRSQIDIRLIACIAPNVITDCRVHILARGLQILFVTFDLVDERGFGDRNADIVLLATLFCRWWRWVCSQRAHVADRPLPKFAV